MFSRRLRRRIHWYLAWTSILIGASWIGQLGKLVMEKVLDVAKTMMGGEVDTPPEMAIMAIAFVGGFALCLYLLSLGFDAWEWYNNPYRPSDTKLDMVHDASLRIPVVKQLVSYFPIVVTVGMYLYPKVFG